MANEFAYLAMNRFGYGANAKLNSAVKNIASMSDAQSWLVKQLGPYPLPDVKWSSEQAIRGYYGFKQIQDKEKQAVSNDNAMQDMQAEGQNSMQATGNESTQMESKKIRRSMLNASRTLAKQNALLGLKTQQVLPSRLLEFFSNHFSVSRANFALTILTPTLETEAIAPYLHTSFADMLVAVSTHPAMLLYLNNERSMGPNSPMGKKRKARKRATSGGLNENLAREILELHTLGVNAGYQQKDVGELARGITGWSLGNVKRGEEPGFRFRKFMHEPGSRALLGQTYPSKDLSFREGSLALTLAKQTPAMAQGLKMLDDLALHPATAEHVSRKIAKYFISDTVSDELVAAMKQTWLQSKGDISEVMKTLILSPLSWQKNAEKFKNPRAFVLSACNACGVNRSSPDLFQALELMGQGFFNSGSPAGYPDEQAAWIGASALNARIEWASHFADVIIKRKDPEPLTLARRALGPLLSQATATAIKRAESKQQALALLLLSPDFQRR